MPISPDQAREIAAEVLIDALALDEGEAFDDARILQDLGAESIDELDIHYRVEKKVGFEIASFGGKLHEAIEGGLGEPEKDEYGFPTITSWAEDQLSTPEMRDRKLNEPYHSMPGTVARLAELIVRESEAQER